MAVLPTDPQNGDGAGVIAAVAADLSRPEQGAALAVGAGTAGGLIALHELASWDGDHVVALFNATLAFAGIAVGFLATTKSILITASKLVAVTMLQRNRAYAALAAMLTIAVRTSLALVVVSVAGLAVKAEWLGWVIPLWAVVTGVAAAAVFIATEKLGNLFMQTAVSAEKAARRKRPDVAASLADLPVEFPPPAASNGHSTADHPPGVEPPTPGQAAKSAKSAKKSGKRTS